MKRGSCEPKSDGNTLDRPLCPALTMCVLGPVDIYVSRRRNHCYFCSVIHRKLQALQQSVQFRDAGRHWHVSALRKPRAYSEVRSLITHATRLVFLAACLFGASPVRHSEEASDFWAFWAPRILTSARAGPLAWCLIPHMLTRSNKSGTARCS